jgi:hypothetical protein
MGEVCGPGRGVVRSWRATAGDTRPPRLREKYHELKKSVKEI